MNFSEILQIYRPEEISEQIYSKTDKDVRIALDKQILSLNDFQAIISPAGSAFIEEMAGKSLQLTQQRFGKTIQLYVPIYLSNFCQNTCVYCGFAANVKQVRKLLNDAEILEEVKVLKSFGYEHILLVTGEASNKAGIEYFKHVFELIQPYFSLISIEVQPLEQIEYEELIKLGLNTVYLYQETYIKERYSKYHPSGKKSDFEYRLDSYERLGRAGVHRIGLGILAGLEDWRVDNFYTALHLSYLQKKYWKTKYSISFPRLRPHAGTFEPNIIMNDKELAQLIFAYRLFDNDVEISLSTRENPAFRDNMLKLGVTSMSAGSKTNPGGYSADLESLEQFKVNDDRTVPQIIEMIKSKDYQPVMKNWDVFLQV